MRWLDRQHNGGSEDPSPSTASPDEGARLLAAFRADPAATVMRPIVRAMSRDVACWGLAHPVVSTPRDALLLRQAMFAAPDFAELVAARIHGLRRLLVTARDAGRPLPPLAATFDVAGTARGAHAGLLAALPAGSVVRIDAPTAAARPEAAAAACQRAHDIGLTWALEGLSGDGAEQGLVRSLQPDGLVFDVYPPMDYLDRLPELLRLRAAAPAGAHLVISGVGTALEAWAAVEVGATHLAGPLYDDEDLPTVVAARRPLRPSAFRDQESTVTAFEMAAASHPSQDARLGALMRRVSVIRERVVARAAGADVYVVSEIVAQESPRARAEMAAMVAAGAALTVVAPDPVDLEGPRQVMRGLLPPDHPLARGWAVVALLPGEGHVLAAYPLEPGRPHRGQQWAFVEAQDRELAVRLASRITQCAAAYPAP